MEIFRFIAESRHDASMLVDRALGEIFCADMNPLQAAEFFTYVIKARGDYPVEVLAHGTGLALAGLMTSHGLTVHCAHTWTQPDEDDEVDYDDL